LGNVRRPSAATALLPPFLPRYASSEVFRVYGGMLLPPRSIHATWRWVGAKHKAWASSLPFHYLNTVYIHCVKHTVHITSFIPMRLSLDQHSQVLSSKTFTNSEMRSNHVPSTLSPLRSDRVCNTSLLSVHRRQNALHQLASAFSLIRSRCFVKHLCLSQQSIFKHAPIRFRAQIGHAGNL